jgi:hypothetical protein
MNTSLVVSDYPALLALHRAIIEAKFAENPTQAELLGSPILAGVANRLVDVLVQREAELGVQQARDNWQKWREINATRREWGVVVKYIVNHAAVWHGWTDIERKETIQIMLSPYVVSEEKLENLIAEVNSLISQNNP